MLSILEDTEFYQQYDKLAEQYVSGIKVCLQFVLLF